MPLNTGNFVVRSESDGTASISREEPILVRTRGPIRSFVHDEKNGSEVTIFADESFVCIIRNRIRCRSSDGIRKSGRAIRNRFEIRIEIDMGIRSSI